MTPEEIFAVLNKNLQSEKRTGVGLMIAGIVLLITGLTILLIMGGTGGLVLACCFFWMGGILFFAGLYKKFSKKMERQTAYAKEVLSNNPRELVWIYVSEHRQNGALNAVNIILKFRNGTHLEIAQRFLPNQDANDFMKTLSRINPDVHLGYSQELKYKYKKKML
jgi:uncharacterized membrane protein